MTKTIFHNKQKRSLLSVVIVFFMMMVSVLTGCTPGASIEFGSNEITMYVGDSQQIEYTVSDEAAEIVWESSDTAVASVRYGVVKALKAGQATIKASVGSSSAECVVKISERVITISQTTATIEIGNGSNSITLTATSSDGQPVTWSSSNTRIATVTNGVVVATGDEVGDVVITAKRGTSVATCTVTVTNPSRPADYYEVTKSNNTNTIADPGVWHYKIDGQSGTDYSFVTEPVHQENSVTTTLGNLNTDGGKRFYLLYQPAFAESKEYTMEMTLNITADAQVRLACGNSKYAKTFNVVANTDTNIEYKGIVTTSEPFSIRINSCAALQGATPTTITIKNISLEELNSTPVNPSEPKRSEKADLAEYEILRVKNADVVLDRAAWYYWGDGTEGEGYQMSSIPKYENGTVTLAFEHINGYSDAKPTYQLRYQPDFAVGEYYKFTASVTVSAPGYISYGTKVSGKEYYIDLEYTEAGTKDIEFIGFVNGEIPFTIGVNPTNIAEPISLSVTNIEVVKTDKPADSEEPGETPEEPGETPIVYDLAKKNDGNTIAAPGVWAYNSPSNPVFTDTPSYNDGVLTMGISASTPVGTAYTLRYQPNLAVGTEYTFTAKVKFEGAADSYFRYGNYVKDVNNYKSSTNDELQSDGYYYISWTGFVTDSKPFYFEISAKDAAITSAIKIVVSDIVITPVISE